MYKPDRDRIPLRRKGVLGNQPPVGAPDATPHEVLSSIRAVMVQFGVQGAVGREYDKQKDVYTVTGKSGRWALPQDYKIPGHLVSDLIWAWRGVVEKAGARRDPRQWLQQQGLLETPKLETVGPKKPLEIPRVRIVT